VFQGLDKEFLRSLDLVRQLPIDKFLLFNTSPEGRHLRRLEAGLGLRILRQLLGFILKVLPCL
jgi:hypothetical protein